MVGKDWLGKESGWTKRKVPQPHFYKSAREEQKVPYTAKQDGKVPLKTKQDIR